MRNADYRTELRLWTATVQAFPQNARTWNNLGCVHQLAGGCTQARDAYGRALDLSPAHFRARWNLEALAECRDRTIGGRQS